MGEFESLLGRSGLLPHGYCFQWSPGLLWTLVGSDTLIALAYFSIPLAILHFVRRRPRGQLGAVPGLFAAFIMLCGLTHVVDIWTIWVPDYELHAAVKAATAVMSVLTAWTLWQLMPKALAIPSVGELQQALSSLRGEVAERQRAERALRHNEQRLRLALQAAALGDWVYDAEADRLQGSELFAKGLGRQLPVEGIGLEALFERAHVDDRGRARAGFEAALVSHGEWHDEFRIAGDDGRWHWLRIDGRWQPDEGGGRLAGVAADTSARHEAERVRRQSLQLAEENRRVQEASRLKSLFLANMSHELRTPLNAVIGFTELLLSGAVPADSPKHDEFLRHVAGSGRHLLQVINDVLDLSKIEAGHIELRPVAVDLVSLAAEVAGSFAAEAAARSVALDVDTASAPAEVRLDPTRLRQVMFNFLSNALKFTPDGGRVTLRVLPEGESFLRIEVEDTGIGIAEDQQRRLFVEFQQLDSGMAKRHQGSGLGLALTRRLVQAQGGRVGVRSEPGRGSCFHAVLPRHADLAVPRVLVAQSRPPALERLAGRLGEQGIAADIAASLAELLERAGTGRHDAWALDMLLEDGPSFDALHALRARGGVAPVRAIGLTDGDVGVMFPVAGVLAKPLEDDELQRSGLQAHASGGLPVLVVDDDRNARVLMQAALDAAGVEVVAVSGGEQALAWLEQHQAAAVVLDLMMPGMDGFQVLERLRAHPRWRELPVFVWTALTLDAGDQARIAAAARRIVAKGEDGITDVVAALRAELLQAPQRSLP